MKAKVILEFKRIGGFDVSADNYVKTHPEVKLTLKDTLKQVCGAMEKYFLNKRVSVKAHIEEIN